MDLGRFLENLWNPRGIWEFLGDIGGFQAGRSGKERQVSQLTSQGCNTHCKFSSG